MTTLPDRPNTALVVIDVQNGVVAGAYERDAVVANIGTLVDKARDEGVPIVWVQHSDEGLEKGSEAWEYVPELVRQDVGAAGAQDVRRLLRGHGPGGGAREGRRRAPGRRRRADRRLHPVHDPRRVHAGLRRDARR